MIGQGAFGVVYRAWDTTLGRTVALKRPRPGALEATGAVERFLREAAMPPACGIRTSSRSTTPASSMASPTWSAT